MSTIPLTKSMLDEFRRKLLENPEPRIIRNGKPCFAMPVHPSIHPHQVALTQHLIDHWDTLHSEDKEHPDDDVEYDN